MLVLVQARRAFAQDGTAGVAYDELAFRLVQWEAATLAEASLALPTLRRVLAMLRAGASPFTTGPGLVVELLSPAKAGMAAFLREAVRRSHGPSRI